jgi:hypothetical protein
MSKDSRPFHLDALRFCAVISVDDIMREAWCSSRLWSELPDSVTAPPPSSNDNPRLRVIR